MYLVILAQVKLILYIKLQEYLFKDKNFLLEYLLFKEKYFKRNIAANFNLISKNSLKVVE